MVCDGCEGTQINYTDLSYVVSSRLTPSSVLKYVMCWRADRQQRAIPSKFRVADRRAGLFRGQLYARSWYTLPRRREPPLSPFPSCLGILSARSVSPAGRQVGEVGLTCLGERRDIFQIFREKRHRNKTARSTTTKMSPTTLRTHHDRDDHREGRDGRRYSRHGHCCRS